MYYRSIGRRSSIPLTTSVTMVNLTHSRSGDVRSTRTDGDDSSVGSKSFLGDVDVLTSMLSGARVEDVAASQDTEDDCEIESESSFVGYIDGVYSFPTSNVEGKHFGVQTSDLECTVATSESTDDTNAQDVSEIHFTGVGKPVNNSKKKKGKGVKYLFASIRRRMRWASLKHRK